MPEGFHNMTVTGTGSEEAIANNRNNLISLRFGEERDCVTKHALRHENFSY